MNGTRTVWMAAVAVAAAIPGAAAPPRVVVGTTFPIAQITRNVTQGRPGITVTRLLPASLGCPHHYALTPRDMRRLAQADVLVVNGLGLEEFLGAPVARAHPRLVVIDSAQGIEALLPLGRHDRGHHHAPPPDRSHGPAGTDRQAHDGVNPHLFASPRMAARLAVNIAAALARIDPDGTALYEGNARAYAARLNALADEMAALVQTFENRRIVQPHGVFDYLARDIGLEIVAVTHAHGLAPSAADMLALVRTIREQNVGAVFSEPQYPPQAAATLAREVGIPAARLDPGATGPEDAPLDYYEQVMRQNMETLRATLGRPDGST